MQNSDDLIALKKMANGDVEAFKHVFRRHYPGVYNFLRHFTSDDQLAEDFTQEVFMKVWEKRADMSDIVYLQTYLCTIGRNIAANYISKGKRIVQAEAGFSQTLSVSITPEDHAVSNELDQILKRHIASLPTEQRRILDLANSGKSHQDIATMLNIATATVKRTVLNARNKLRVGLGQYPEFPKN